MTAATTFPIVPRIPLLPASEGRRPINDAPEHPKQKHSCNGSCTISCGGAEFCAPTAEVTHWRYAFADGAAVVVSEDGCLIAIEAHSADVLR